MGKRIRRTKASRKYLNLGIETILRRPSQGHTRHSLGHSFDCAPAVADPIKIPPAFHPDTPALPTPTALAINIMSRTNGGPDLLPIFRQHCMMVETELGLQAIHNHIEHFSHTSMT